MPVLHHYGRVVDCAHHAKTYKRGKYMVTINPDGSIKVKHGDWLTKYSAAVYGDFFHVDAFQRKSRSGTFVRVHNPNLIFAGEVVYHIPTATHEPNWLPTDTTFTRTPLSERDKRDLILAHIKGHFDLKGDGVEFAERLAFGAHTATEAAELAEALECLSESVGEGASLAGIVLFPIDAALDIFNSWETGYRHYGMRAVAYGITSWAWNDAPPPPPSWIHNKIPPSALNSITSREEEEAVRNDNYQTQRSREAWIDGCQAGRDGQDKVVAKNHLKKDEYQILLQGIGNWDRNGLVKELLKKLGDELGFGWERASFDHLPTPNYPNV